MQNLDKFSQTFKQKAIDKYLGKKIERFTIIEILDTVKSKNGHVSRRCIAQCECGTIKEYKLTQIGNGTKSCGCLNREVLMSNHLLNNKLGSKYTYNESFFETLTPESAYFLGYLYSDGCLTTGSNMISITSADEEILIKLNNLISTNNIVRKTSEAVNNNQSYYRLSFSNKKMYQDLLDWGLYPNKSLTLTIPELLQNNKDFWRGMIDGDGSCFTDKNNRFVLGFCGTKEVCESYKKFLNTVIKVESKICVNSKSGLNFAITVHGSKALFIHKFLYENNTISMDRKSKFDYLYPTINQDILMRPYKVKQLDLEMNLIKIWDSVKLAAIGLGIAKENIQSVLGNDCSTISGGFKWEYVHKPNKKYSNPEKNIVYNMTGFRGVTINKNGTFDASFSDKSKKYFYYGFKTAEDAARHYDKVCWKLCKKQYLLNFNYDKITDIEDVDLDNSFKKVMTTKCGYKFINSYQYPNRMSYNVLIPTNGKTKYYGSFKTIEEAIIKRDSVLDELNKTNH